MKIIKLILFIAIFVVHNCTAVIVSFNVHRKDNKTIVVIGDVHLEPNEDLRNPKGNWEVIRDKVDFQLFLNFILKWTQKSEPIKFIIEGNPQDYILSKSELKYIGCIPEMILISKYEKIGNVFLEDFECRPQATDWIYAFYGYNGPWCNDVDLIKEVEKIHSVHALNRDSVNNVVNMLRQIIFDYKNLPAPIIQCLWAELENFKKNISQFYKEDSFDDSILLDLISKIKNNKEDFQNIKNNMLKISEILMSVFSNFFDKILLVKLLESTLYKYNIVFVFVGNGHAKALNLSLNKLGFNTETSYNVCHNLNCTCEDAVPIEKIFPYFLIDKSEIVVSENDIDKKIKYLEQLLLKKNKQENESEKKEQYSMNEIIDFYDHNCIICSKKNCAFRCNNCKKVYYCSKKCQAQHWFKFGHKEMCCKL